MRMLTNLAILETQENAQRNDAVRTHLQNGFSSDRGHDSGAYEFIFNQTLSHSEEHRGGQEKRREPHGADQFLRAAPGHDALRFERVTDGHEALNAQTGDVERRRIRAPVPQKVVAFTHSLSKSPRMMHPDEVVQLNRHAEDQDEKVRYGQARQVIMHRALEILKRFLREECVQGDGIP